jgi:hypothetical protein
MSEMQTPPKIAIERCCRVMNGNESTIRRRVKSEVFLAFKLNSWLMFVEETEPTKPKENAQLDLF